MLLKINYFLILLSLAFLSCQQKPATLFTNLPSSQTNITFENKLTERPDLGILNYIYYYNGGGVAVGDINNDGLPDIYFTANSKGNNKLYLNKGHFQFEDITNKAGVAGTSDWCSGVTMADVNGDGLLDIYVCAIANMHGLQGHNELFINKGNGVFAEQSAAYGLNFSGFSTQAVFFDYDHDGDLDCFVLNQSEHPNQHIQDTSNRRKFDANAGERMYRNDLVNGQRKFTDVSAQAGVYQSSLCYGLGISVADVNNDGWEDMYVGNDFHENDFYYINNHNGTFTESGANHFRHYSRYSMGNDIADFNNDGQLDVVTVDMLPNEEKTLKTYGNGEHLDIYKQKITNNGYQNQYSRNCLQRNNGNGESFSDVGLMSGISATDWSWSPLMADFDNDGNKDLFISTGIVKRPLDLDFIMFFSNIKDPTVYGSPAALQKTLMDKMPDGASFPHFFKGNGQMDFKDISTDWGTADMKGYFNGAAYADLDNDGKLDMVINAINAPAVILQNNTPTKNFLSIAFKSDSLNRFGIGAKAYVFTQGKTQYQQLMLTRGFMSSTEPKLHFGLDSIKTIDSILIVWPNQMAQTIKNVAANHQLVVLQKDAKQKFDQAIFFPVSKPSAKDISAEIKLNWKHQENDFTDFNEQYLIPHLQSTRGPKLAVADINKDGLDDLFVCGAKGQAGCLFVQNKSGGFTPIDTAVFSKNKQSEGVDAIFFDANGDGFPDLYVVSGGNEYADGNPNLADHLYMNDGKGNFNEAVNAMPSILKNKSCVAVADVNKDGYEDIFVGGLSIAKQYGNTKEPSYLLLNDGKGHFTKAEEKMIPLSQTGIVTSATFADVNKDGWPDLIVAGEWMGIHVFINHKGVFQDKELNNSSGLWQTVYATDVNDDGFPDILAGNWGLNSKLCAGKDGPLKMYVKDYDFNGSIESVVAYSIKGQEFAFLGKDELDQALPSLKHQYLSYDEVAGMPIANMFADMFKNPAPITLTATTLASSCFMNDGKGNFTRQNLPQELQLAPIFSFANFPAQQSQNYFAIGNFYGVLPYEGRYDALNPSFFGFDQQTKGTAYLSQLPAMNGECRDAKWINCLGGKKLLVVSRNNDRLVFLRP